MLGGLQRGLRTLAGDGAADGVLQLVALPAAADPLPARQFVGALEPGAVRAQGVANDGHPGRGKRGPERGRERRRRDIRRGQLVDPDAVDAAAPQRVARPHRPRRRPVAGRPDRVDRLGILGPVEPVEDLPERLGVVGGIDAGGDQRRVHPAQHGPAEPGADDERERDRQPLGDGVDAVVRARAGDRHGMDLTRQRREDGRAGVRPCELSELPLPAEQEHGVGDRGGEGTREVHLAGPGLETRPDPERLAGR